VCSQLRIAHVWHKIEARDKQLSMTPNVQSSGTRDRMT
jgi:hypothetical protein